MTDQLKILLITFIVVVILIYISPNAESAMILITSFWGFIYLNNALFDYKTRADNPPKKDVKIEQMSNEDINDSELDNFHIAPEVYDEHFENKPVDTGLPDENVTTPTYDPNLEYTPDKIGYMRHDMENRTHQNELYSRCYKPLKGETNDCDLYEWQPIDERMSEYWRQIGYRGKKLADGAGVKSADYFRANFNTEFEREEKKVWWETEGIY
jgi:prepilin signal peptidase PulO-like enzyme (type II secretory pathway)